MSFSKKGISTLEMQRQLGHKFYEPVWAMMHKIRKSMFKPDEKYNLTDMIEFDEGCFEVETSEKETQNQILVDLHKLLFNYRILLPFTIHQQVGGKNLIDWLLHSPNYSKKKFKFLTFLTLNVNLFIKREGYNFISLSDFVCARIITNIMNSPEDSLWNSFSALYLSQVRKFS